MKKIFFFISFLLFAAMAYSQTTYTWIGSNSSWATATNWSPTRTTPAANDILQFDDGGTYTITSVPSQTIGQLLVTNNTNITLQSSSTTTLSINGPTLTNNLVIASGSTLQISATSSLTITMTTTANQRMDISGTLNIRAGIFSTTGVSTNLCTVSSTGVVNHYGGTFTGSAATLLFTNGSNYNYLATTSTLSIPTATWDTSSNVNITAITTASSISNITGQSFGNFTYNCPSQTSTMGLAITGTTTRFKGNFTIENTNTGSVSLKTSASSTTINIDGNMNISGGTSNGSSYSSSSYSFNMIVQGNYNQSGGTFNYLSAAQSSATFTIYGDFVLSGGTFNAATVSTITSINLYGNYNQTAGTFTRTGTSTITTLTFYGVNKSYIQSGGLVTNTYINYIVASPAVLTLNSNLTTAASRTFAINSGATLILGTGTLASAASSGGSITNSGSLYLGTNVITGSGTFSNTSSSSTYLYVGHASGIAANGTYAGNIQVSSTRNYGAFANYIYNGTAAQITGNGYPSSPTGTLTIDNPTSVTLSANTTNSNAGTPLILNQGLFKLGNFNYTLSSATAQIGGNTPSASNMVVTNGTGRLIKAFPAAAYSFTFPVGEETGTTEYTPFTLTFTSSGATSNIGVLVVDATHGSIGGASHYLSRYWSLSSSSSPTYSGSYSCVYTNDDINGTESMLAPARWNGASWTSIAGSASSNLLSTSGVVNSANMQLSGTLDITGMESSLEYYRSVADGNWTTASIWETDTDPYFGSPTAATVAPTSSNSVKVIISAGTKVTVSANITAVNIEVAGTLESTVTNPFTNVTASLNFTSGSVYEHNVNGGALPLLNAPALLVWDTNSTVKITGITNATSIANISGRIFGNWEHNSPSQTSVLPYGLTGTTTRFLGNFTVNNTGTGSINLKSTTSAVTVNIDKNLQVSNGTLNANTGSTAALTLNIYGDYIQAGGIFNLSSAAIGCIFNLYGNYNQTNGTFNNSSSTVSSINFLGINKTYSQTGGTLSNNYLNYFVSSTAFFTLNSDLTTAPGRNFVINIGASLILGSGTLANASSSGGTITNNGTLHCGTNVIGGSGSFINSSLSSAYLYIGHTSGIAANGTYDGNIQVSGSRSYGVLANYIYNGTAAQITGNGYPVSPSGTLTIDNPTSVTLSANTTNSNASTPIILNQGLFILDNFNYTLSNAAAQIGGNAPSVSNMIVPTGSGQLIKSFSSGASTFTYPVGDNTLTAEYSPVTLQFTANSTTRNIGVRLTDDRHPADMFTTDYLSRYWSFTNSNTGTATVNAIFNYPSDDINGTEANIIVNRYDNNAASSTYGQWQDYSTTITPNQMSINNIANFFLFTAGYGFDITGRTMTNYYFRSRQTGNWNVADTWEVSTDSNFINPAPVISTVVPTSGNSNLVIIQSGHTVTATANVSIDDMVVDGTLNVNTGITFSVLNGTAATDMTVNGSIISNGTLTLNNSGSLINVYGTINNNSNSTTNGTTATLIFKNNSIYSHNRDGGSIPIATWDTSSNVNITAIISATSISNINGQSFGNFTYNCPSQTSTLSLGITNTTTRFKGDFTVENTNTGSINFKNSSYSVTVNIDGNMNISGGTSNGSTYSSSSYYFNLIVKGNYNQSGGTFNYLTATQSSSSAFTIYGDFVLSGGTFNAATVSTTTNINLYGNYNHTAGTFTRTGTTTYTTLNFYGVNKSYIQTGGVVTNTYINYVVASPAVLTLNSNLTTAASRTFVINSGGTLILGTGTLASAASSGGAITNSGSLYLGTNVITGSGTFSNTSSSSTYLYVGHASGIAANGTYAGNIQVSSTRTYGASANYIYNGTVAQITGNGYPASLSGTLTIDNPTSVTLSVNATNSNAGTPLILNQGLFILDNFSYTLSSTAAQIGGNAPSVSNMIVPTGSGQLIRNFAAGVSSFTYPVGDNTLTAEYSPVTLQFTANSTARYIGLRLTDDRHPADLLTTDYLSRYWSFTNSTTGSATVNAIFNYTSDDINGTEANILMNRYDSNPASPTYQQWNDYPTTITPNQMSISGVNNFFLFTAGYGFDITGRELINYFYRSKQSGDWNDINTWEVSVDSNFISPPPSNATAVPTSGNSDLVLIQSSHVVTVTASVNIDDVVVDGTLAVNSGITFSVLNGSASTDMTVNGMINNEGTLTLNSTSSLITVNGTINNNTVSAVTSGTAATLIFADSSTYNHNRNAGTVPTATWQDGSTLLLSGCTANQPSGLGQSFYHFTYSGSNQTQAINLSGGLTTVRGNFTLLNTGSYDLRFIASSGTQTTTIMGNLDLQGGTLYMTSGSYGHYLYINGNFLLKPGATFGGNQSGATTASYLYLDGDYIQTGGTVSSGASSSSYDVNFYFRGSGKSFTQSGGTFTPTNYDFFINTAGASLTLNNDITVYSPKSFALSNGTLYCGLNKVTGTGTFTTNATTATLGIGSPDGITLPGTAAGNIQTTNRTYGASTNYLFNGNSAQQSGNGFAASTFPSTANVYSLIINNPSGVTLSTYIIATANINLTNGFLDLGNYDLVLLNSNNTTAIAGNPPSASNMILTNGSGRLIKYFGTTSTVPFTWPLGDNTGTTEYSPITITFASNALGYLGMRVTDAQHPSDYSTTDYLSRYWSSSVVSGLASHNYTLTAVHNDAVGNVANMKLNHFSNTAYTWTEDAGSSISANSMNSAAGLTNTTFPLTNCAFTGRYNAGATPYFRTFASGNWADASTWEVSTDPAFVSPPPVPAGSQPTAANCSGILIRSGHTVIAAASANGDDMRIETGGELQINSGQTFTVANGTGTDLTVQGIITNFGTITTTGTVLFDANSYYNHALSGGVIPTATWDATSTARIVPASMTSNPTGFGQTFGNFIWNPTTQSSSGTINAAMNVNGDMQILSGTFADNGYSVTGTAGKTFTLDSGAVYTTTRTAAPWFPSNMTYVLDEFSTANYNGATGFTMSGVPTVYGNLSVAGGVTKTLPAATPFTVYGNLTVSSGTLANNANNISVKKNVSGTVSGTGKVILIGGSEQHLVSGNISNMELNDTLGAALSATLTITSTLDITDGTFNMGGYGFTGTGSVVNIYDSLKISSATGSKTFNDIIVHSGGNFVNMVNSSHAVYGNIQNDGNFSSGSGTYTLYSASKTTSGVNSLIFNNLTSNGTRINNGELIVNGTFTVNSSYSLTNNSILRVTSTNAIGGSGIITNATGGRAYFASSSITPTLTASAAGNTVTYNGTASVQTAKSTTYANLVFDNTFGSTNTIGSSTVINDTLSLLNGAWQIGSSILYINGDLVVVAGSITGGTVSNITVGASGSPPNITLPSITGGLRNLTLNRASGLTLGAPLTLATSGVLTLTTGILTTSDVNLLSITNTATTAVSGASVNSYVSGPIMRNLPSSLASGSTYLFPVGKSEYQAFELINPTTTSAGTVSITVEAYDVNPGGTDGAGFNSATAPDKYWFSQVSGAGSLSSAGVLRLRDGSITAASTMAVIGCASTQTGAYNNVGGVNINSPVNTISTSMVLPLNLGYFRIGEKGCIGNAISTTIYPVGNSSFLQKISSVAGLLNSSLICGNLIFELQPDYVGSTAELLPIVFNQMQYSGGTWNVAIRPSVSVSSALITSGDPGTGNPLINLNGADNITFDGVPGGSTAGNIVTDGRWIIRNTRTSTTFGPTIQLVNDAVGDTLKYLQIEGQNTTSGSGTVVIGTTTGTTGNDNNLISYCAIRDRSDVAAYPNCAIYAIGTSGKDNDNVVIYKNHIFNFWNPSASSTAIDIGSYNTAWTITGNSLYQTATRTSTSSSYIYRGISVENTSSGNNFVIDSNYIGGSAPQCAGTAWTKSGSYNAVFRGITLSTTAASTNSIANNTISNISWTCYSNSTAAAPGIFSAIYTYNGGVNIINNTIGAETGTGSIIVTTGTSGPASFGIAHSSSNGNVLIDGNKIGSITVAASSSSYSHRFVGITVGQAASGSTRTISNNLVGSLTTANSIYASSSSSDGSYAQYIHGITLTAGANPVVISGNTVANIRVNNNTSPINGKIYGIYTPYGVVNINNNTIYNLTLNATSGSFSGSYDVNGILMTSPTSGVAVYKNIIHSLSSNGTSGVTTAVGIYMQTSTSGTNEVYSNFIHSFNLTTTGAGATMAGIHLLSGNMNVYNNMIRLGINASGSSITQGHYIYGIREVNNLNNIYHNSVYLGGSGVSSAYNTYCFFSGVITGAREIKNNIFWNARSNASGTAKNYAINVLGITGMSSNNNLLNSSGTGGVLGAVATNDYNTLSAWQLATSLDNNSITGDPRFMNATGDASVVDLHIDSLQNTPIEAMGTTVAAVTLDYDLENRAGLTPVDIGADAGDFSGIDETAPSITYTSLTNACNTDPGHTLSNVNITDNSGVNVTPGTKPRLYFKKSGDANDLTGWKFVEASGSTSPFSFTFNFSDLNDGGVSMNDVIQYFVVAQDEGVYVYTPNVAINSGVFASTPSSVALTASAFPVTGTINSFTILPCSGTVTVGTGGNYPAFTTANGLFQALNQATINGNMNVSVISDITIEDGTHALNEFTAPYSITIHPDGNTLRNITGTYNGGSATLAGLFRLNGADSVIIDGRDPGNLSGNGQYLLFRNSNNTSSSNLNSTFTFINDAKANIIRYCVIEGATVGTTNGVILFSTALATGNSNNIIDHCVIKNAGTTNTTLLPTNGIVSAGTGTSGMENSGNIISDNNIYDFFNASAMSCGIRLINNGGSSTLGNKDWDIYGNSIYETTTRNFSSSQDWRGVSVEHTAENNFDISNNYIGGTAPLCGGSALTLTSTGGYTFNFVGIRLSISSSGTRSSLQGNTIANVNFNASSTAPTANGGIIITQGSADVGTITANVIGSATVNGSINVTTAGGIFHGIYFGAGGVCDLNIQNNVISGITMNSSGTTSLYGIRCSTTSPSALNISNNVIGSTSLSSSITQSSNASVYGIYLSNGTLSYTVGNNLISGINISSTGSSARFAGIYLASGINDVSGNIISNVVSSAAVSSTGASASLIGIIYNSTSYTGQQIRGNTIYDFRYSGSTAVNMYGIYFNGSTSGTNIIEKNNIFGFNLSSSSSSAQEMGIYNYAGNAQISNNMIRMGVNSSGTSEDRSIIITGIYENSSSANNIYNNSVFIGGVCTGTSAANTYAYRRISTSGADNIRNNIFANDRLGGGSGSTHYAFTINGTISGNIFDYNIYYSKDNSLFSINSGSSAVSGATSALKLQYMRGYISGNDLHSGIATLAQINYVNPNGSSSNVDLHLNNMTSASGAGISISGLSDDFDGDIRNNPPDIGADEGSFDVLFASTDIYSPNISYTSIPAQSTACSGGVNYNAQASITDLGAGVPQSGTYVPQMWWRRSAPTSTSWTAIPGTLQSGDGFSGTWTFNLLIPTPLAGETYQYYFTAQDEASQTNIWYSHYTTTTPVHSNVVTQTTAPSSPASFAVNATTPLSGTVIVGGTANVGETWYGSLTRSNGFFRGVYDNGLSGDVTVMVRADVTTEDGNFPLYEWQNYCGGTYSIRIVPETQSLKTLSGSLAAMGLFTISGADSLCIDGSYNGSGRYLKFANTYSGTGGSENNTFRIDGTAVADTIMNCDIEGQSTKAAGGVVYIASANVSDLLLKNNLIHGGSAWVVNGILATGGSNISIHNNEIYNFLDWAHNRAYGIKVTAGGNNWNINGNSIYNTGINGQSAQTAISFMPGAASLDNEISNNWIGGSSAQCGTGGSVTYWGNSYNPTTEHRITGIDVSAGNVAIDSNNMTNIWVSGSDYSAFVGVHIGGSTIANMTANVFGTGLNGQPDNSKIIQVSGGGISGGYYPGYIYGIWNESTTSSSATYDRNDFYYLFQSGSYTGGNVHCIAHQTYGPAIITGNRINGPQASGIDWNQFGIRLEPKGSTTGNLIENNIIAGPYVNSNGSSSSYLSGVTNSGIYVRALNTYTVSGKISKNIVWDLRNADRAGYTEGIYVWSNSGGNGNWEISNNMVSLNNNNSSAVCIGLYGIDVELNSASSTDIINNTVYISGSNGGSPIAGFDFSSYAFFRYPNQSGTVTGDAVNLKNNIFINTRLVSNGYTPGHFAIANYGTSNFANNWNESDYNFLLTGDGSKSYLGQWGSTTCTDFNSWKTNSAKDKSSWSVPYTSGSSTTTALNPVDLFVNGLSDLSIKTDNQACWFINGKGVAGSSSLNLSSDINGDARTVIYGFGTDIGADEFTPDAGVNPYDIVVNSSGGGTQDFNFAGRKLASITWNSGTPPSQVSMRYYSGVNAPNLSGVNQANFYYNIEPSGGSNYNYDISFNYDDALLGSMLSTPITESDMVIAKTDISSNWNDLVTNIDVNLNVFSSAGLTAFSDFTGKNPGNPLPVELIAFNTTCDNGEVLLSWTTATETNCDYYIIEKSTDALQWTVLGRIQGSGNSNHLVHYSYRDKNNDGLAYYRLLQLDYDGQTGVYGPVYANCEQSSEVAVDIYPNPFVDELYIVANGEGNMQLRLSDEFGKEVAAWNFTLSGNMKDVFKVATSNLAKGIYFAEILIGKEVFRKKLVKG